MPAPWSALQRRKRDVFALGSSGEFKQEVGTFCHHYGQISDTFRCATGHPFRIGGLGTRTMEVLEFGNSKGEKSEKDCEE